MFNINSLILTVGPSLSGKSYWASRYEQILRSVGRSVVRISSDDIRYQLTGIKNQKAHQKNKEVSGQAFEILKAMVKAHMAYPVLTEVVIVDTTGLGEEFRDEMFELAQSANYSASLAVFTPPKDELLKRAQSSEDVSDRIVLKHLTRLKEDVLPVLKARRYHTVVKLAGESKVNDWLKDQEQKANQGVPLLEGQELKDASVLKVAQGPVSIIGDLHESHEALEALLAKLPKEGPIVFCGDLIDIKFNKKANEQEKDRIERLNRTLSLVEDLKKNREVRIVLGNHERYVLRRLKNEIDSQAELESTYFNSFSVLEKEMKSGLPLNLAERAFKLFESATHFLRIEQDSKVPSKETFGSVVVTHAPVAELYLEKVDSNSSKLQSNIYFKDRSESGMREQLGFVKSEASKNKPLHVFGHVAIKGEKPFVQGNKVWLDTGAVYGNKLSAVVIGGRSPYFVSVDTRDLYEDNTDALFEVQPAVAKDTLEYVLGKLIRLDEESEILANRILKGRAQFISGTMVPAPSKGLDIESLEAGLHVFKAEGVDKVILQPKFMGSRAQVYLYKDNSMNFVTSRDGHDIKHVEGLQEYVQTLSEKYAHLFETELILDGELLPWAAMGKGLIEHEFKPYIAAVKAHLEAVKSDSWIGKFKKFENYQLEEKLKGVVTFEKQLELFGQPTVQGKALHFEAFNILKKDGKVLSTANQEENFKQVSSEEYLVVDLTADDCVAKAKDFYNKVVGRGLEGIVIKPVLKNNADSTPYMKVRNKEYLTLIYGYDYGLKLQKLCAQKSINSKRRLSVKEVNLGNLMLEHSSDPQVRSQIVQVMFGALAAEKELDPRL